MLGKYANLVEHTQSCPALNNSLNSLHIFTSSDAHFQCEYNGVIIIVIE